MVFDLVIIVIYCLVFIFLVEYWYNDNFWIVLWSCPAIFIGITPFFFLFYRILYGISFYKINYPYFDVGFYFFLGFNFIVDFVLLCLLLYSFSKIYFHKIKVDSLFKLYIRIFIFSIVQFTGNCWSNLEKLFCKFGSFVKLFDNSFFSFIKKKYLHFFKNVIIIFMYFGLFLNIIVSFIEIILLQQVFYLYYSLFFMVFYRILSFFFYRILTFQLFKVNLFFSKFEYLINKDPLIIVESNICYINFVSLERYEGVNCLYYFDFLNNTLSIYKINVDFNIKDIFLINNYLFLFFILNKVRLDLEKHFLYRNILRTSYVFFLINLVFLINLSVL